MSSFFLFSIDKPPASSLILALGLNLGLGLITKKRIILFNFHYFLYIEMSVLQKFKTNSYCVGGRHHSGTKNIRGLLLQNVLKC